MCVCEEMIKMHPPSLQVHFIPHRHTHPQHTQLHPASHTHPHSQTPTPTPIHTPTHSCQHPHPHTPTPHPPHTANILKVTTKEVLQLVVWILSSRCTRWSVVVCMHLSGGLMQSTGVHWLGAGSQEGIDDNLSLATELGQNCRGRH